MINTIELCGLLAVIPMTVACSNVTSPFSSMQRTTTEVNEEVLVTTLPVDVPRKTVSKDMPSEIGQVKVVPPNTKEIERSKNIELAPVPKTLLNRGIEHTKSAPTHRAKGKYEEDVRLEYYRIPDDSDAAIDVGALVYIVEKIECDYDDGAWMLIFKGKVDSKSDKLDVVLLERYSLRFHPDAQGISNTDWWCVPKRRFCYSKVDFSDWNGKFRANGKEWFPLADIFRENRGLVPGAYEYLQKKCGITMGTALPNWNVAGR